MNTITRLAAVAALALAATGTAQAAGGPAGLWYDETGRGAVEIADCGGSLCGKVVWIKDADNDKACGMQILGGIRPAGGAVWQGGWVYDPDRERKFDVELTLKGDKLVVFGYAGIKMFGESVTWTRAPANLKRCSA